MAINILIVEDCSVTRFIIIKTLERGGIEMGEIYEADNGAMGLQIIEENKVDLMLMDINMPVMDGMEMLRQIRARSSGKKMPVLVVSTQSNIKEIESLERLGAAFLHKPFTTEQLRDAVYKITKAIEK